MWRRTYLFLILVRLFFALSPSYLHPDEHFQGPEVIAGRIFSYPVHLTWEFTSDTPVRSSLPLWLGYGIPMYILRLLWEGAGWPVEVPPQIIYWTLRIMMFLFSFVLEDWAVQELVHHPGQRRVAVMLVASSYVTWTLQTHTFSNAFEALILLWSLVLITRIVEDRKQSGSIASAALAFLLVLGTFNRVTFPAFAFLPCLRLLPHFNRNPASLVIMTFVGIITALAAIAVDTAFYNSNATLKTLFLHPVIAPLNSLRYNASSINLEQHGLHPYYQHVVANLPQLLGPALPLVFFARRTWQLFAAIFGTLVLSAFPHQEARFLIPAIPLILSSIRLPRHFKRAWVVSWITFNVALALIMGIFHQGGVVPAQIHIGKTDNITDVFWWKTYSPPVWLLNGKSLDVTTHDLMGMPGHELVDKLLQATPCNNTSPHSGRTASEGVLLVAPRSAAYLNPYLALDSGKELELEEIWSYRNHVNLDDLDFGDDGVWPTLQRVVGRRGLVIRRVRRYCGVRR